MVPFLLLNAKPDRWPILTLNDSVAIRGYGVFAVFQMLLFLLFLLFFLYLFDLHQELAILGLLFGCYSAAIRGFSAFRKAAKYRSLLSMIEKCCGFLKYFKKSL